VDVIEREIAEIVAEVAESSPEEALAGGTLAEAGIDSLMAVEIAVDVERRYGFRFTEEELSLLDSFESLVALTRSKLVAAS
jgi:acyl carrier protein